LKPAEIHYVQSTVRQFHGAAEKQTRFEICDSHLGQREVNDFCQRLFEELTNQHDYPSSLRSSNLQHSSGFIKAFNVCRQSTFKQANRHSCPLLLLHRWPEGAPFALLLSHDIDQIYDRELFRVIADINHIRRVRFKGEKGNITLGTKRLIRSIFRPKRTLHDFETILEIERRHGFRSTFFVLHDLYWARQGARFSLQDNELKEIGRLLLSAGCELGVHGGYYRFNNATAYRQSREAISQVFGIEAVGIRNHLLRFSYPETWRAQAEAGFEYDTTYGWPNALGPRSGLAFPFFTYDKEKQKVLDLIELPLTVMDTTLFRYLKLEGEQALNAAWEVIEPIATSGGLVTLLWHNNYFNEPEYRDWQVVYQELLRRLASLRPWCATGAEINRWWRKRSAIRCVEAKETASGWQWVVEFPQDIDDTVFQIKPSGLVSDIKVEHSMAKVSRNTDAWEVHFPKTTAGTKVEIQSVR